jgi:Tol biopolymer transport system component
MKNKTIVFFLSGGIAVLLLIGAALQVKAQDSEGVYLPLMWGKPLPPPSGWVVFDSDRDGDQEIYRMRYDGSELTQLTFNTGVYDVGADWSPDGEQIAYVSSLSGEGEIYVMDADGSNPLKLTELSHCGSPQWSPDGTKIAFDSRPDDDNLIFTMNADGSELTQITPPEISGYDPYWSPDGLTIAFLSSRIPSGLYTVDAAGATAPVLVWENPDLNGMAWSPDGEQFAVIIGDPYENSFDVYLYDLDSGTTTRLTDTLFHSFVVDWFPSGNYLTFMSDLGGTDMDIYTMTATGTQLTNITNNPAYDASPDWKP